MPKLLPRIVGENIMPGRAGGVPMSPNVMDPLARAMEGFGEALGKVGKVGEKVYKDISEAAETERIINTHYKVKDEFMRTTQGFKERVDYEKFDDDAASEEDRIRTTFAGGLKTRREKEAFSRSFGSMASSFRETIFNKKAQIITNNALAAFDRTYSEGIDMYITTSDPEMQKAIKTNLEIESAVLVEKNIMKPDNRDALLNKFEATAEETKVRMVGLKDPMMAREMLDDPNELTHIDKIKKVALAEHMETRIRLEGSRIDKLSSALQRENQANALDDFALGQLDFDKLMGYRARDEETGKPGLSDAFFSSMLAKVKGGADYTDEDVFNRLYTKDELTLGDVEEEADSLSVKDQRTLLRRIVSEQNEIERDSRYFRRQQEMEERRVVGDEKRIEKERRASWARTSRSILTKGMNEVGVDVKDGADMLRTFQGYVDDPSIAPEDLPDMVEKLIEPKRGGVVKWFKGLYSSWAGGEKEKVIPEVTAADADVGFKSYLAKYKITNWKDPRHQYDYYGAYKAGVTPVMWNTLTAEEREVDIKQAMSGQRTGTPMNRQAAINFYSGKYIWPDQYKQEGHPVPPTGRKSLDSIFGGKGEEQLSPVM